MRASSFSRVTGAAAAVRGGRKCETRALREVVGEVLVALRPMPTTETYSVDEKWELTRIPQILVYRFLSGSSGSRASAGYVSEILFFFFFWIFGSSWLCLI